MTNNSSRRPAALMLGTAGHVDHGKTSLVKRLTGVNTDRLKEEQQRGMTIDFGVAPLELPDGRLVGIIDVPGHEDFIRNMVSGASSMDILMLVVAADDAVMPQTAEHMQIAMSLGVRQVMSVITKIDLVDADLLELVREDVRKLLAGAGFPEAPLLNVSNETGEGIDEVRRVIAELSSRIEREPDERAFRMYVRDIFSIKGHGTIVTGVPVSGRAAVGDPLELLPAGKITSIRAVQTYKHEAEGTQAHLSSAVNVRDLQPEELSRGMVLAAPGIFRPARTALVWLENTSQSIMLKTRSEVRLHAGTASVVCRLRLLMCTEVRPGSSAFGLLRLKQPVVLAAGDRFVIRVLSPAATIGGGIVLSAFPALVRRPPVSEEVLESARQRAAAGDPLGSEMLAGPQAIIKADDLRYLTQTGRAAAEPLIRRKEQAQEAVKLAEDRWIAPQRQGELVRRMKVRLAQYHQQNKYLWGMKPAYACEILGLPVSAFPCISQLAQADPAITFKHGHLALSSFQPAISERDMKLREAMLERVTKAGSGSVARGDLQGELGMTNTELKIITKLLVDEGLIRTLGNNYMLASIVEECRQALLELFGITSVVELNAFREKTGLARNIAVTVLEHFDSEGMTRRQGPGRALLRGEANAKNK